MNEEVVKYLRAVELAHEKHEGQRYGEHPYTRHLAHVESVLRRHGVTDSNLLAAAWLHDVLEDSDTYFSEIKDACGFDVARLVYLVTDEAGQSRAERKLKTLPKIRTSPQAVLLKLADRIANIEACIMSRNGLLGMYRSEQAGFEAALRRPGEHDEMWASLDSLLA